MSAREQFERLVAADALPARLDIVQCDVRWLEDPAWRELRAAVDRRIYAAFLRDRRASRVRRLILYDVPEEPLGSGRSRPELVLEQDRWIAGLVGDLERVDGRMQTRARDGEPATYDLRQAIVGRRGAPRSVELPSDGVAWEGIGEWARAFDRAWSDRVGTIQDNRAPDLLEPAQPGDRSPSWHLWHSEPWTMGSWNGSQRSQ